MAGRLMVAKSAAAPSGRQVGVSLVHSELGMVSQAVRFALEVKGVAWSGTPVTVDSVFDYLKPWSARFNPSFCYPVLFVDNQRVDGLSNQFRVLDLELQGPALLPGDPDGSTRCDYWVEEFLAFPVEAFSHMWAEGDYESLFDLMSPEHQEAIEVAQSANPALAHHYEALGQRYAQVADLTKDTDGREHLQRRLREQLNRLNRALTEREFLAGKTLSAADIVWSVFIARLEYLDRPLASFELPLDQVVEWYDRIKSRPEYAAAGVWEQPRPRRLAQQFVYAHRLPIAVAAVLGLCALISLALLASSL
jgi:glutathione S-transferase